MPGQFVVEANAAVFRDSGDQRKTGRIHTATGALM
jgi:hypothetical protein